MDGTHRGAGRWRSVIGLAAVVAAVLPIGAAASETDLAQTEAEGLPLVSAAVDPESAYGSAVA